MPSVRTISSRVFSGDGVVRFSDATYGFSSPSWPNSGRYQARTDAAIELVQRLRGLADSLSAPIVDARGATYEDVANLARQIAYPIPGEYENPALLPLLTDLRQNGGLESISQCATDALDYIRDIVWRLLDRPVDRVDHLDAITDACRDLGALDLFDLNHDRVLAKALGSAGVDVCDGFTDRRGDALFWRGRFIRPIRHFKLHGSIDWVSRWDPKQSWRGQLVARSTTNDRDHERDENEEYLPYPADGGRPEILVGTFDKSTAYGSRTIFPDQHARFHESLHRSQALVVIGYGFRDEAINSHLIGWLDQGWDRPLVVVHPEPTELRDEASGGITREWSTWERAGRLQVVKKRIEEATWSEIADALLAGG